MHCKTTPKQMAGTGLTKLVAMRLQLKIITFAA